MEILQMPRPNEDREEDPFLRKFIPGTSASIRQLRARIAMFNASTNVPLVRNVLILGESGAGKNYVAEVMAGHRQWLIDKSRSRVDHDVENPLSSYTGKFIEVSLPSLPDALVESELFGHVKGAFTGAVKDHLGIFGEGYHDVLLDEIGDASAAVQSKLLRVLNSGQFRRVGAVKGDEGSTDARVLMATHRPLASLVSSGAFREDLLWRIRQFVLYVPPLREQRENLRDLTLSVLAGLTEITPFGLETKPEFTGDDMQCVLEQPWPGNVRQLRHALAKWLVYRGTRNMREVVAEGEGDGASMSETATESRESLPSLAAATLERARTRQEPLGDTVSDFVATLERQAKRAIVNWLDEARPTAAELTAMFPAQPVKSLRTMVARWRNS